MYVEQLEQYLGRFEKAIESGSLEDAFKECHHRVRAAISGNFTRGGSPGNPWPARKQKARRSGPTAGWQHPLLILSGALYEAATSDVGSGHVFDVGHREFGVGVSTSTVPYAAVHQHGSARVPQRKFLAVDEATVVECRAIVGAEFFSVVHAVRG